MCRVFEKLFESVVLFCVDILLYFCCQFSNPIGGIRCGGLAAELFALVEFLSDGTCVNRFVVSDVASWYKAFVCVCYYGVEVL